MNCPSFFLIATVLAALACTANSNLSLNLVVTHQDNKNPESSSHPISQSPNLFFVVEAYIGLPPTKTLLTVNTAFPLSLAAARSYNKTESVTFMPLSSTDRTATAFLPWLGTPPQTCTYEFGLDKGQYGQDIFSNFAASQSLPFGAGDYIEGLDAVEGILGLAVGHPLSMLQQLPMSENKFSYCLPYNFLYEESTMNQYHQHPPATLDFGDAAKLKPGPDRRIQATSLLSSPQSSDFTFYYLNLSSITVAATKLPVSVELFSPSRSGFIVDSGAPYSLLIGDVYGPLRDVMLDYFGNNYGVLPINSSEIKSGFDLCFPLIPPTTGPSLELHFGGEEAILRLPASATFRAFPVLNEYCIMILPIRDESTTLPPNVFGAYQQIGHRFVIDIATSTFSFTEEKCFSEAV